MAAPSADFFTTSYNTLVQAVKNQPLNADTMINVVTKAMQIVETAQSMTGPEKKQAVIALITKLINDSASLSADVKTALLALPYSTIIDTIVAATKSQFAINLENAIESKCGGCGCFGSSAPPAATSSASSSGVASATAKGKSRGKY